MRGIFWNIRGLNHHGRNLCLGQLIREHTVDFIGVQETKKESFHPSFLKNLTSPTDFSWEILPAKGTAGGILIAVRDSMLSIYNVKLHSFSISCVLHEKAKKFRWKLLVVYGPAYDDKKIEFIDELHNILSSWQGPILIGGDFNLCRCAADKSNGKINQRLADCFNNWINRCGLVELSPSNRNFVWSNNQVNPVLARLDRIFASTEWECDYPLARVSALPKGISDHTPLLVDTGCNLSFGKKKFRFEKWWLEREDFREVVTKVWSTPCSSSGPIEVWQIRIRALRRIVRGWANNVVAELNKHKQQVTVEYN
jgi:exonuclease III